MNYRSSCYVKDALHRWATFLACVLSFAWLIASALPAFASTTPMIAAGAVHTVGLKADGTAVAVGNNTNGQTNVSSWTGLTAIAAGGYHTIGLKADGTVVAAGWNGNGQTDVSSWTGITAIAGGQLQTVGLKADGTAVAVGYNPFGQTNVSSWTGISAISAGITHSVGLKADGTVVATGDNSKGQTNVSSWTGITAIAAAGAHTVGLKSDGTVVAVGDNSDGQTNVSSWTDIIAIAAGDYHTVGLKADGTVVAVGWNLDGQTNVSSWTGITAIAAGGYHTIGLKADGTVVATGWAYDGQTDVSSWQLNAINHTLTYTASTGGSIEGSATQTIEDGGDGTQVTAVPDTGYHFVEWSDGVDTATRTDTEVTGDIDVTATFAIDTYTLTYTAGTGGSIEGSATQTVEHSSDATTVTAVPAAGYKFVAWSDGVTTPSRIDEDVTAHRSVTAFFASNPHTVFYTAGTGGAIEGQAIQDVSGESSATTVTAVPLEGYRFVSWSDGLTTLARRDTDVTASKVLVATFQMVVGEASAVVFTPKSKTSTLMTWSAAEGATGYRIWINGRLIATVGPEPTNYLYSKLLGPDATVEVEAIGAGTTASPRAAGVYSNTAGTALSTARYNMSSPLLTTETKRELTRLAQLIADKGFSSVEVAGHTSANAKRSAASHRRLSLRRAAAAKTYLAAELKRFGATATITAKGYGTSKPVASNRTAKGRAKNRRVEIVVK